MTCTTLHPYTHKLLLHTDPYHAILYAPPDSRQTQS